MVRLSELPWLSGFVLGSLAAYYLVVPLGQVQGQSASVVCVACGCLAGFAAERYFKV